jgi:hypothetical protein
MIYNDYVEGKKYFEELLPEKVDNFTLIEQYNDFLKDNNLEDFLKESIIANISDEAINEAGKGNVLSFFIGYIKLKNNINKYIQAYLAVEMTDIEEAKLKHSDKWDELESDVKKQKEESFKVMRKQRKDVLNAITTRMDEISKSSSKLQDLVGPLKAKAKLKAIEKVMKLAKSLYTDNQMADLKTTYDGLKIKAVEGDKKQKEIEQDEAYKKAQEELAAKEKTDKEPKAETKTLTDAQKDELSQIDKKITDLETLIKNIKAGKKTGITYKSEAEKTKGIEKFEKELDGLKTDKTEKEKKFTDENKK